MRLGILAVVVSLVSACGFSGPGGGNGPDASGDDDATPPAQVSVAFATATSLTDHSAMTHVVQVALSAPATGAVTVNYKVVGGTALSGTDYKLVDGMLTFAPGTTEQDITMQVLKPATDEPDVEVTLALDGPEGATLGQPSQHHVTISANMIPRVSFATGSLNISEAVTSSAISVAIDKMATVPIMVDYKVVAAGTTATGGGVDYTLADGTLTISAATMGNTIPLAINNDLLDEDDETVEIQLSNPVNAELDTAMAAFTYTILDDDLPPTVQFASGTTSLPEAAGTTGVAVTLSAASGKTITVPYTVALGTASLADVAVADGTLTFAPGDVTKSIPVAVTQDTLDEDDETFTLTLGAATNATPGAILSDLVTIVDDDAPPTISITTASSMVPESVGTVMLTVALTTASGKDITVSFAGTGTATEGTDYSYLPATHALDFPAGTLSQTIMINVVQDMFDEVNETVITTLTSPTNATLSAATPSQTLTILDDDPTCLGPTGNFQVCLVDMPTAPVTLGTTLNTDGAMCAQTLPVGWAMVQPDTCFIIGTTITQSGATKVTGGRPLALVASGNITIAGTLDVSSRQTGSNGPGSGTACASTGIQPGNGAGMNGGGGGAGGSFMSQGAAGGLGSGLTLGGSPAFADGTSPTVLRAGCAGQRGGTAGSSTPGAAGKGGGGVYVLSGGTLVLDGGTIDASGAGGTASDGSTGGSGAGSGGMIKLFASAITATNMTKVFANGGGGASGADNNSNGMAGMDPMMPTMPAPGGMVPGGNGGTGGTGFAGNTQATSGGLGGLKGGGGGGGGGGGFLQSNHQLPNAVLSAGQLDISP